MEERLRQLQAAKTVQQVQQSAVQVVEHGSNEQNPQVINSSPPQSHSAHSINDSSESNLSGSNHSTPTQVKPSANQEMSEIEEVIEPQKP